MKTPTKALVLLVLIMALAFAIGCVRVNEDDKYAETEGIDEAGITGEDIAGAVVKEVNSEGEEAAQQVTEGERITVQEGKLVEFNAKGNDPDGDAITYTFSSPLNESGKWQTKVGDKGTYNVQVKASDGKSTTIKTFEIIVKEKNKAPVLEKIGSIRVTAGETVVLSPKATDANDDELNITYSGWMSSPSYTATENDIGNHKVTVTVTDGELADSEVVSIDVVSLNHAPVLEKISDIVIREGDTITFDPKATDADGDKVTITYSGWMSSPSYTTDYDDAGDYVVKITASDGKLESSQTVKVTVKDTNRPVQLDVSFEIS